MFIDREIDFAAHIGGRLGTYACVKDDSFFKWKT